MMNFAWEELVKDHCGLYGPSHVLHIAILSFVFHLFVQHIVQVSIVISSVQQPMYEEKTTKGCNTKLISFTLLYGVTYQIHSSIQ